MSEVAGIKNHHNNCFINCALQVLLNLDFVNQELAKKLPSHAIRANRNRLRGNERQQESMEYLLLYLEMFQHKSIQKTMDIARFYDFLVSKKAVKSNQQGDCHEFLLFLVEQLSHAMKKCQIDFVMEDLFRGKMEKSVTCHHCRNRSVSRDCFTSVALLGNSVEEAFEEFRRPSKIDDYQCDKCRRVNQATINIEVTKMPVILAFHSAVKQSRSIDLDSKYQFSLWKPIRYRLYGTVHHQGSHRGGHYYCQIIKNDSIYDINDESVRKVPRSDNQNIVTIYLIGSV
jgi:ubiquitin C-terminal hydrolase